MTKSEPIDPSSHPPAWTGRQRAGLVAGAALFVGLLVIPAPADLAPMAWRAAAVALLMAVWWMTEALPIPVTSLLPLLLLPLLGVAPIGDAAAPYANPLIFLFLGGFLIALAMEESGLHRRLALRIIRAVGTAPRRIVLGFMAASAFLSMWISNTATAMMMLPIGLSVVALVRPEPEGREGGEGLDEAREDGRVGRNFGLCLLLGIAYGASLGGMATLVGTPTNALLAAFTLDSLGLELGFARWMAMALPLSIIGLGLTHWILTRWVYPIRVRTLPGGSALLDDAVAKLGPLRPAERRVGMVFGATALLWLTRPILGGYVPGLSDAGIAIFGALVLFALPLDWRRGTFVLRWEATSRLPWGVLLLFGGGLSLAAAIQSSGLAAAMGGALSALGDWPPIVLIAVTVAVIVLLTELTSNTATAAAFLPVLAAIAAALDLAPMDLLVPATLAASCAFMLPVATPPNAIVYGSGRVSIPEMARAGAVLNALFVVLLTLLATVVTRVLV